MAHHIDVVLPSGTTVYSGVVSTCAELRAALFEGGHVNESGASLLLLGDRVLLDDDQLSPIIDAGKCTDPVLIQLVKKQASYHCDVFLESDSADDLVWLGCNGLYYDMGTVNGLQIYQNHTGGIIEFVREQMEPDTFPWRILLNGSVAFNAVDLGCSYARKSEFWKEMRMSMENGPPSGQWYVEYRDLGSQNLRDCFLKKLWVPNLPTPVRVGCAERAQTFGSVQALRSDLVASWNCRGVGTAFDEASAVQVLVLDTFEDRVYIAAAGDDKPFGEFPIPSVDDKPLQKSKYDSPAKYAQYKFGGRLTVNWDELEAVWLQAFTNTLLGRDPVHNSFLMLTEPPVMPRAVSMRALMVMCEYFHVPMVTFVPRAALTLYQSGRSSGVVVDCGRHESHAVPIYEGFVITHAIVSTCVGCDDAKQEQTHEEGHTIAENRQELRTDVLFQPKFSEMKLGIHEMTASAIAKCDFREPLYGNILLAGSCSLFANLQDRFKSEMVTLTPPQFRIHVTSAGQWDWLRGSVVAFAREFQAKWVSLSEYEESGPTILLHRCP